MKCLRLYNGSIKDCACRLSVPPWWLPCPEEAQGLLEPVPPVMPPTRMLAPMTLPNREMTLLMAENYTGDICTDCQGVRMVRTGTCLRCEDCYSQSGGCS